MASFAAQESTLVANTAQFFFFKKELGGFGAQSLVYMNDSANIHTLQLDNGSTFTVAGGKQRVVTGLSESTVLKIGGNAASQGAYRLAASSELEPPIIEL
jgi:hypothetical protein